MKTTNRKTSTTMRLVFGMYLTLCLVLIGSAVHAGTKCYDFSGPAVGTTYEVGKTVETKHSKINLKTFMVGKEQPSQNEKQEAEISKTNIVQTGPPSLLMHSIRAQVVPKETVQKVRFSYAENTGGAYIQNLGVNGQMLILDGGLAKANGQELGKPENGGTASVSVTATPGGGNWVLGTVELNATPGSTIKFFSFGGNSQFVVDNVCIRE